MSSADLLDGRGEIHVAQDTGDPWEPGSYAALDGFAVAGPAPSTGEAVAALNDWMTYEGYPLEPEAKMTLWTLDANGDPA